MLLIPKIIILKSIFPFLAFLIAWEMVWKGIALYKAGQKGEVGRFICIFIFNTFGLLPIIYLLVDNIKDNDIEEVKNNNKITDKTEHTKKITKGGVLKGDSVMQKTKSSSVLSETGERTQKEKRKTNLKPNEKVAKTKK